ncbi:hypothetical protein [Rhizobium leguminosarum]|uniref:hypothetical protein n=1 Tax=Rhizobium leguminosarum TaxID=384 RepID=UPI001039B1B1|nr:hypothetical protein [Rhizobium leguminosarum]TBY41592.1 hypothetical protein E0H54_30855 [Rhizobium leguminosarum bv. viciae]
MPLSQSALPSIVPDWDVPFDTLTAFANGQTITATGYVNAIQAQVDIGVGRWIGKLNIDISALDLSSGDETYRLFLLGSNDAAFANGNVEILNVQDFAAASAGRLVPTIVPASDAVPVARKSASRFTIPVTNQRGIYVFRYLQLYAVLGGTTPSITLAAWLAGDLSA